MTLVPAADGTGYEMQPYQQQPQYQPAPQQVVAYQQAPQQQQRAIVRLTDWAQEAKAANAIAQSLANTQFAPEAFRGRPAEATAAILTGFEMGLSPMAALRAIYVIKGTPAMYAKTMRAIVQAKGHEIWVHEATSTRVIVKGRRKGSDNVESSTWTTERAKTAGLLNNAQYSKNPQNMLTARATSEVCWLIASDALYGIGASVEELEGGDAPGDSSTAVEEAPAPKRRAQRKPLEQAPSTEVPPEPVRATATAGEPQAVDPVSSPPATGHAEPMTDPQRAKMFALFGEKGVKSPNQQRSFVSDTINRQIASRSDLSKDEAKQVIDALERLAVLADVDTGGADLDDPVVDADGEQ